MHNLRPTPLKTTLTLIRFIMEKKLSILEKPSKILKWAIRGEKF